MPIIHVHLLKGRSVAQKRGMIAAITNAVVKSLGVAAETVRILIDEVHPEHFALAGVSAGEKPLKSRKKTDGANTLAPDGQDTHLKP